MSIFELIIVVIVAILVLTPKQMLSIAKTLGNYLGKARRLINKSSQDLSAEMTLQENLRKAALADKKYQQESPEKENE